MGFYMFITVLGIIIIEGILATIVCALFIHFESRMKRGLRKIWFCIRRWFKQTEKYKDEIKRGIK